MLKRRFVAKLAALCAAVLWLMAVVPAAQAAQADFDCSSVSGKYDKRVFTQHNITITWWKYSNANGGLMACWTAHDVQWRSADWAARTIRFGQSDMTEYFLNAKQVGGFTHLDRLIFISLWSTFSSPNWTDLVLLNQ
jgi:hypothetical protein